MLSLRVRSVAFDELGDIVRPLLGQIVAAILENLNLDVGPAVMGAEVLRESRHNRPEDVFAANEHQRNVDGAGAPGVGRDVGGKGAVDRESRAQVVWVAVGVGVVLDVGVIDDAVIGGTDVEEERK
jgi:hypothetical protein